MSSTVYIYRKGDIFLHQHEYARVLSHLQHHRFYLIKEEAKLKHRKKEKDAYLPQGYKHAAAFCT